MFACLCVIVFVSVHCVVLILSVNVCVYLMFIWNVFVYLSSVFAVVVFSCVQLTLNVLKLFVLFSDHSCLHGSNEMANATGNRAPIYRAPYVCTKQPQQK